MKSLCVFLSIFISMAYVLNASAYEVTDKQPAERTDYEKKQIKLWKKASGYMYKKLKADQKKANCVFSTSPLKHQELKTDKIMHRISIQEVTTNSAGRNKWVATGDLHVRCYTYPGAPLSKENFTIMIYIDGRQSMKFDIPRSSYRNGSVVFKLPEKEKRRLGSRVRDNQEIIFQLMQLTGRRSRTSTQLFLKTGWTSIGGNLILANSKFRFYGTDRLSSGTSAKDRFAEKAERKTREKPIRVKNATCETTISSIDPGMHKLNCPANCHRQRYTRVAGSGEYDAYSQVCVAAIHAGVLGRGTAGVVTINVNRLGSGKYTGSSKNGIKSKNSTESGKSYTFSK